MLVERSVDICDSDGCEMRLGTISGRCHLSTNTAIVQRIDLSFSWYCRLPVADTVGAAVRMDEAMLGLAAVARTRPAWAGTAAATLLNMAKRCVCVDVRCLECCDRLVSMGDRSVEAWT